MDEICERYAKARIYRKHLTPPVISKEYIKNCHPEICSLMDAVEQQSGCRVSVRDEKEPQLMVDTIHPLTDLSSLSAPAPLSSAAIPEKGPP